MSDIYDAIVIGGGINGGSVAYNLAKRGHKVLLLEKDRVASKASGAAAGMLAAQAELDEDGPFFKLARKSRNMYGALAGELKELSGIDIELVNKGMLKIALTSDEESEFKRIINVQRAAGEQADWLSSKELCEKEQLLAPNLIGAMYIEKDGQLSAPQLTLGFLKSAASLGVEIKEYVDVQSLKIEAGKITGVITDAGEFTSENVVVTGGAWSKKVLAQAGVKIETYPVKGECFSVLTHKPLLTSTIFSHGCYMVPKKGGRIIVGATVKPHTFNQQVTLDGVSTLMKKAIGLLPAIADAEWEKAWAGIRPQTIDGYPYLGEHPEYKGLFVATGHFRNGILLAAITGEVIADLVEGKQPVEDLTPFRIDRHLKTLV